MKNRCDTIQMNYHASLGEIEIYKQNQELCNQERNDLVSENAELEKLKMELKRRMSSRCEWRKYRKEFIKQIGQE